MRGLDQYKNMKKKKEILEDLRPEEHVIFVARHHWWWLLERIIGLLILFFVPFFFFPILAPFLPAAGTSVSIPPGLLLFFGSLWALILWQVFFAKWTDFYYDTWIITNWRIVDIDQRGLWNRDVATLFDLDYIQDISTRTDSVIANLLGFGDIKVQTAAADTEFKLQTVKKPRKVEGIIRDAQEEMINLKTRHNL